MSPVAVNIGQTTFEAVAQIVRRVSGLVEEDNDAHARNALLTAYIQYQGTLPHPDPGPLCEYLRVTVCGVSGQGESHPHSAFLRTRGHLAFPCDWLYICDNDAVRFENLHPRILRLSTRESESPKLSQILGCSLG